MSAADGTPPDSERTDMKEQFKEVLSDLLPNMLQPVVDSAVQAALVAQAPAPVPAHAPGEIPEAGKAVRSVVTDAERKQGKPVLRLAVPIHRGRQHVQTPVPSPGPPERVFESQPRGDRSHRRR